MATQHIERKVHHLGTWNTKRVDPKDITTIKQEISNTKGHKVKLQLSADGLRSMKTSVIQGKMLVDYIPMARLKFFTIVQNTPNVLFVVALVNLQEQSENKFQIIVFRCSDNMDASLFASGFQKLSANRQTIHVVRGQAPRAVKEEEINWTLRSKEADNSKRELKQMVEMNGGGNWVTTTTTETVDKTETEIIPNGHTEVFENGVRIPIYRKGKPSRLERESFDTDTSDNRSEVSEGALRMELESLSQELRDIKVMLEKSTGMTTGSEPGSPRDFEPVNVKVHTHTTAPEIIVKRTEPEEKIETVIIDDDKVQMRPKQNGYTVTQSGSTTHVRVSVPDYRSVTDRTSEVNVTRRTVNEGPHYEVVKSTRPSTTSYESWKRSTMDRTTGRQFNDFPERIQWRSRSNRASHVVTTSRPRTAIPSFSDSVDGAQVVEVRHHPAGVGPTYGHVSFNPRVMKMQERKTQSLRVRGLSTTVAKPIERVYTGRPDAKHHSLSYRPQSGHVRPSILVKDTNVNGNVQPLHIEQNNNVIKSDDDQLLDVSGIDLYRETPIEGTVIRT